MAGLPEGWEADYDGKRWFYRYKATGLTQWTFPQPGDEFPEHFDPNEGPLSLDPEEKLASERQLKRRNTADGKQDDGETRAELQAGNVGRAPHDPDRIEMSATGYFDPEDFLQGVGFEDEETAELPGDHSRGPVGVVAELVGQEGVRCAEELAPVELDAYHSASAVPKRSSTSDTVPAELSIEKTQARLQLEEAPRSTSAPPRPPKSGPVTGANFVYTEEDATPPAASVTHTVETQVPTTRERSYSALQPGPAVVQNSRVNEQPAASTRPEISRLMSQENEVGLKRHSLCDPPTENGFVPNSLRPAYQSDQAPTQQFDSSVSSGTQQGVPFALAAGRPHASTLVSEPIRVEQVALRPRSSTGNASYMAPDEGFSVARPQETIPGPTTDYAFLQNDAAGNPIHSEQPSTEPPENSVRNTISLLRTESTAAPVKPRKQATIARLRRQNNAPLTPTATFNQIYEVINLVEAKYSPDPEEQGFPVPPLPTDKPEEQSYSQAPNFGRDSPKPLNISPRQPKVSPPSEPSPKPAYTSSQGPSYSEHSPKPLYIPPRASRVPEEIPRPIYSLPDEEVPEAPKPLWSAPSKPQEPARTIYSTSPPPPPQSQELPKPQPYSVELRDEPVSVAPAVAPPVVALTYGRETEQATSTQDQPRSGSIPLVSPESGAGAVSPPEHPGTPSSNSVSASPQKRHGSLPGQVQPFPTYTQQFVDNQFVQSRPVSRLSQNTQGSQDSTGTSTEPPRNFNAAEVPVGPDGAVIYEMDSMPAEPKQETAKAPPVQYLSAKQLEPRRTSMVTSTTATTTTTEEEGGIKKWARKILQNPIQPRRDSNPRRPIIVPFPAEAFERKPSPPPQLNLQSAPVQQHQDAQQQQNQGIPAVQHPQPQRATDVPAQRSGLPSQVNRASRQTPPLQQPRRDSPLQSSGLAPLGTAPPQQQLQPSQPIRRRPVSAQILAPSNQPQPPQQQYRYSQTPPQSGSNSLHPTMANTQGAYAPPQQRPQVRGDPDAVSVCSTESITLPSPPHQQQRQPQQQQQAYQNHYQQQPHPQPPYPQQQQQQQPRPQPPYPNHSYPQQQQPQQQYHQQYRPQQQQQQQQYQQPQVPPKQHHPQHQYPQQPQHQAGLSYQGRQYPAVVAGTYPPVAAAMAQRPPQLQQQQPPPAPLYYHQHTAQYQQQQQQQQGRGGGVRVPVDYSGNGWGN